MPQLLQVRAVPEPNPETQPNSLHALEGPSGMAADSSCQLLSTLMLEGPAASPVLLSPLPLLPRSFPSSLFPRVA